MAVGLTNVEIGGALITSPRTASSQVAGILHKLDQPTRAAAAAAAVDAGLLVLPFPGTGTATRNSSGIAVEIVAAALRGDVREDRRGSPARRSRPAPIRIGSVVPKHGSSAADATEMRNGSQLAISDANARGGVRGHRLEQLVVETDIAEADAAKTAIQSLIATEVDAITSGYFFGDSTILDGTVEYGAPYLHGQTAEAYVEFVRHDPQRHGNIFQVCPSETNYGIGFLRFLDQLVTKGEWRPARRSVVLIETPVSGGLISTAATLEHAEMAGWNIEKVIEVSPVSANWDDVASEIRRLDSAAIMIASFLPEELAGFQQAFVAAPTNALVYAVYTPSIPAFRAHAGRAAEGLLWSTVSGTYGDAIGRRFSERYANAFGRRPGRGHAGIAYDEIQLLVRAWSEVDNIRDFKQVSTRLRNNTHRGVNGSYCFDSDGQCGLSYPDAVLDPSLGQAHLVLQVRDGRDRIVSPAPYVEDHFVRPPWFT
jgi:branched-chain amino acid transport system substrate-binding protein